MAKLTDIPTSELRRALKATERFVGRGSASARVLRRELERRERAERQEVAR
ncbi:MAG: hypothetical protein WD009_01005 [Phycisphaeraceae bacterium]